MGVSKFAFVIILSFIGSTVAWGLGEGFARSSEFDADGGKSQTQDPTAVLAAYESGVTTKKDFDLVFDFINESEKDAKWREIPWIPNLWNGIEVANEKKKPIFMWAMNGDPLGCV